jgi:hypothetical protein
MMQKQYFILNNNVIFNCFETVYLGQTTIRATFKVTAINETFKLAARNKFLKN